MYHETAAWFPGKHLTKQNVLVAAHMLNEIMPEHGMQLDTFSAPTSM